MPGRALGHKTLLLTATTWSNSLLSLLVSILRRPRTLGPAALGSIGFSTGIVGLVMPPRSCPASARRTSSGWRRGRTRGDAWARC